MKRTAGPGSRSKRLRSLPPASDLQEAEPAVKVQDIQSTAAPGMVQLNLQGLTDKLLLLSPRVLHGLAASSEFSPLVKILTGSLRIFINL